MVDAVLALLDGVGRRGQKRAVLVQLVPRKPSDLFYTSWACLYVARIFLRQACHLHPHGPSRVALGVLALQQVLQKHRVHVVAIDGRVFFAGGRLYGRDGLLDTGFGAAFGGGFAFASALAFGGRPRFLITTGSSGGADGGSSATCGSSWTVSCGSGGSSGSSSIGSSGTVVSTLSREHSMFFFEICLGRLIDGCFWEISHISR